MPNPTRRFDDAPVGQLVAVVPEPGTKVKKGAKVQLIVSAGQPQVIFTNEKDILRVNGANGQKLDPIADDDALLETNPTWNAAGTHVAYAADGRIMLKDITKDNADAVPLSPAGSDDSNLAWAPIADTNVIAFTRATAEDADLCFGKVTRDGMDANCIIEPKVTPNRVVHWAPDGKSILAFAGKNDQSAAGIMRWRLKQGKDPFSSNPSDWSKGRFVSDIERPNKIMIDATISPDGKQIAMISNLGSSRFQLFLGDVKDGFDIEKAKKTNVRACKVVWRSDGRELLVDPVRRHLQREGGRAGARRRHRPAGGRAAQRLRRRPGVPAADARGLINGAVPQLPSPARARSELLRQLRGAPERGPRAARARARRWAAGADGVGADDRARARVDARALATRRCRACTRGSRPTRCWRTSAPPTARGWTGCA